MILTGGYNKVNDMSPLRRGGDATPRQVSTKLILLLSPDCQLIFVEKGMLVPGVIWYKR